MGLQTIAEFVENSAILEKLKEIGVEEDGTGGKATPKSMSAKPARKPKEERKDAKAALDAGEEIEIE